MPGIEKLHLEDAFDDSPQVCNLFVYPGLTLSVSVSLSLSVSDSVIDTESETDRSELCTFVLQSRPALRKHLKQPFTVTKIYIILVV